MPIFETFCGTDGCDQRGKVHENYYRHWDDPNPNCETCGIQRKRAVSTANAIWCRPMGAYGSPEKEGYREAMDGHWVVRKNSSRRPDGKPEREFITSIQQQRAYCKEEGLIPPDELSSTQHINKDGSKLSSVGLPGCWT